MKINKKWGKITTKNDTETLKRGLYTLGSYDKIN